MVGTTAAAAGLPRGFSGSGPQPLLLADDAAGFAAKAELLYTDAATWTSASRRGVTFLQEEASTRAVVRQTAVLLEKIVASRPATMASAFDEIHRTPGASNTDGAGFSAFTRQIEFARKAAAMGECSSDHTLDLLTFPSGPDQDARAA